MFNLATHILIEKETCHRKGEEILGVQLSPKDYADLRKEYTAVMAQWGHQIGRDVRSAPDTYLGVDVNVDNDLPSGAPMFITRPKPGA